MRPGLIAVMALALPLTACGGGGTGVGGPLVRPDIGLGSSQPFSPSGNGRGVTENGPDSGSGGSGSGTGSTTGGGPGAQAPGSNALGPPPVSSVTPVPPPARPPAAPAPVSAPQAPRSNALGPPPDFSVTPVPPVVPDRPRAAESNSESSMSIVSAESGIANLPQASDETEDLILRATNGQTATINTADADTTAGIVTRKVVATRDNGNYPAFFAPGAFGDYATSHTNDGDQGIGEFKAIGRGQISGNTLPDIGTYRALEGTPAGTSAEVMVFESVNLNQMGPWGHRDYQNGADTCGGIPGGETVWCKNYAPDIVVKKYVSGISRSGRRESGGTMIMDQWLIYPHNAASDEMAVYIRAKRASFGTYHDARSDFSVSGKANLRIEQERFGRVSADFFLTEAHLVAPGSAVQPTGTAGATATWTGKVIAHDSNAGGILLRGQEIGGDASVTVTFGTSGTTASVALTNLRGVRASQSQVIDGKRRGGPVIYGDQSWGGLTVTNGGFSSNLGRRSIEGTFRNQKDGDTGPGSNADTVGGIFVVADTMRGGFVAKLP